MKNINEMTNKGLDNLAKVTLPTIFFNCIQGHDKVQKECWKIMENLYNNPAITVAHKLEAIRVAGEVIEKKFNVFVNGPAMMTMGTLRDKVERIKKFALDNNDSFGIRGIGGIERKRLPYNNNGDSDPDPDSNSYDLGLDRP
jgi:hypothetical protein